MRLLLTPPAVLPGTLPASFETIAEISRLLFEAGKRRYIGSC